MIIHILRETIAAEFSGIIEKGSPVKVLTACGLSFIFTGAIIYALCRYLNFEPIWCYCIAMIIAILISLASAIISSKTFTEEVDRDKIIDGSFKINTMNTGLTHVVHSILCITLFSIMAVVEYRRGDTDIFLGSFTLIIILSFFIYFIFSIRNGVISIEFADRIIIKTLVSKQHYKLTDIKLTDNHEKNINYPFLLVVGEKNKFEIPIKKVHADWIKDYVL
jgi:hypothetical protein